MRRRRTQPACLLIIADPSVCSLLGDILKDCGIQVRTAPDGTSALACLPEPPRPGLILLDMALPDMPARAFVDELAKLGAFSSIPCAVIAETAATPAPWAQHLLVKPISIDILVRIARACCGVGARPARRRSRKKK
jgi:CheY-like chemotaxis protein